MSAVLSDTIFLHFCSYYYIKVFYTWREQNTGLNSVCGIWTLSNTNTNPLSHCFRQQTSLLFIYVTFSLANDIIKGNSNITHQLQTLNISTITPSQYQPAEPLNLTQLLDICIICPDGQQHRREKEQGRLEPLTSQMGVENFTTEPQTPQKLTYFC